MGGQTRGRAEGRAHERSSGRDEGERTRERGYRVAIEWLWVATDGYGWLQVVIGYRWLAMGGHRVAIDSDGGYRL